MPHDPSRFSPFRTLSLFCSALVFALLLFDATQAEVFAVDLSNLQSTVTVRM